MSKIATRRVTSPFFIGLFVIFGSLIVIGVIIWLGSSQFLRESMYYVTYFDASVEGLESGSPVKYLGVPVGSVSKIQVAPDGRLIEVTMNFSKRIEIPDSLRVKAEISGIAGGKFLQLHFPSDPAIAKMYPKYSFEPPYPVIRSSPSGIEEIEIALREVMNKLNKLETKQISDGIVDFLTASTNFFSSPELYTIIAKLDEAGEKINNILAKADTSNVIENLNETSRILLQTSNDLNKFSLRLNTEIDSMDLPGKVQNAFTVYDSAMYNTREVVSVVGFRMENLIFSVNETLEALKKSNKHLQKTLRAISDNPSQVFFSEPPPPEK